MTGQASKLALTEKPPPMWGCVCEVTAARDRLNPEKPPPKWGVLCEILMGCTAPTMWMEKPPPKWGGVCER